MHVCSQLRDMCQPSVSDVREQQLTRLILKKGGKAWYYGVYEGDA